MQSTPYPNDTDPHDVIEITPDVVLVARGERAEKQKVTASLAPDAADRRSDPLQMQSDAIGSAPAPRVDTTFRATAVDKTRPAANRSRLGKWASGTVMAFLFALCSAVAAAAWQAYGDTAEQMIAKWTRNWVPHVTLSSLLRSAPPSTDHVAPSPPQPSPAAAASAPPAPAAAAPVQTAAPQATAPAGAIQSTESTQILKSMAHDLSATRQEIEELKHSLKQLNDREEQTSRELAKLSEQRLRPKISAKRSAPASRPAERRPRPPIYHYRSRAASAPALQPSVAPPVLLEPALPPPVSADPVPTPPMPVR
ncbi:MAG: hypothetical protein ACREDL_25210 [Bradyrhizobium sp.]